MKRFLSLSLIVALLFSSLCARCFANFGTKTEADRESGVSAYTIGDDIAGAYLVEASTGKVLFAKNEYKSMIPASVTKIMTLLLVCEAIDSGIIALDDNVTVSQNAASKGGSQIFLKEGERMSVLDLLKSTIIASANDAAVALAELVAGSESAFVRRMNKRAAELGLKNTVFENATGLDDTATNHYSCPADIAKMSIELIKHGIILEYSSLWQDSIRNGEFTLTNTNRLVRYYDGCNGLKTGSTDKAGYCVSASAKRGNMQLIAVIMGAPTRDIRNNAARELLDYGFAEYALYERGEVMLEEAPVISGKKDRLPIYSSGFSAVIPKDQSAKVELVYELPESLKAPVAKGSEVGRILYKIDGKQIGYSIVFSGDECEKIEYSDIIFKIFKKIFIG